MADTPKADELALLLGDVKETVSLRGGEVVIRPMTLAQIAEALIVIDRMSSRGVVVTPEKGQKFDPVRLLLRGGADALELLRIASCLDAERINALDALEGARLFGTVYRVNADFFDRNRAEMLSALEPVIGDASRLVEHIVGRVTTLLAEVMLRAGLQTLSDSSNADTPSTLSEDTLSDSSRNSDAPPSV